MTERSVNSSPMVFISYRRDDTGGDAGRLNDTLNQLLGPDRTFFDFEQIAPGMDFEVQLKRALGESRVLLALIGPNWEKIIDSSGKPRLEDKKDFVRMELVAALKNKKVQVVPILLNRDAIPKQDELPPVLRPITRLNAFVIRRDRWQEDVATLLKKLGISQQTSQAATDTNAARQARLVSASVEWKRRDEPDPNPRRWVVYVDNGSDAPITVEKVKVSSASMELSIEDWGAVRPNVLSDYELEESDFNPSGDRPEVIVRFIDSYGRRWSLNRGMLKANAKSR